MTMPVQRLIQAAYRFGSASQANVAITFAVVLIPLLGCVGAAVDYSRANYVKTAMQAAADATALTAAKSWAANGVSATQLEQSVSTWFNGEFNGKDVNNVQVTSATSSSPNSVTVTATGSVTTDFLGILGIKQLDVSVSSTAAWGMKLQLALVLDNTGSMAEYNKMPALKTASHQLLQQLQNAATHPGDIEVAIIPFTTDVNVGHSNVNGTSLKWSYTALNGSFGSTTTSTVTVSNSGWSGCVADRDQNYDVQNTAPNASDVTTLYPADNPWLGCPPEIMPLGHSWTPMNNLIDQMQPLGETNLTIGLVWGWQALTPGSPLNAPASSPNTAKVIIFMTDGFNTANRWTNVLFGSGTTAQIDARTQLVCQNIKAAGITVYTVQIDTGGGSPPSTLLQNCASNVSKWFYLTNPGELVTTFGKIAANLSNLRLAR
jgi:Flp pilus assembly protein TadG